MQKIMLGFIAILLMTMNSYAQEAVTAEDPNVSSFHIDSLLGALQKDDKRWTSFIKGKNVLTGLYHLKAGEEDRQQPHDTDEVYYVIEGKAKFITDEQEIPVTKGSVLFVKAEVAHKFVAIEEDLVIIVFFDQ
ncbi:MAG: cupin domain-containing protein [Flavobacteriaceae bacterium]